MKYSVTLEIIDYGNEDGALLYFKAPRGYCGPNCFKHEHILDLDRVLEMAKLQAKERASEQNAHPPKD